MREKDQPRDDRVLRVLYCILDSRYGGPHRRAETMSQQLRTCGVETFFLLGCKSQDVWRPADFGSFVCRHIQCFTRHHPLWNLAAFCVQLPGNRRRIRRFMRVNDIDVVHVDGVTNFVPALAARLSGTTLVWHYNDHPHRPLKWLLLRLVRSLSSAVIVQGEKLREARTGSDPKLRDKTHVLYPGVDLQEFDSGRYDFEARTRLRKELGVPPDVPLVGIIGNLNPLKGHPYFIRAAQRVKEKVPNTRFLVVGRELNTDPKYGDRMRRLANQCGLKDDLIFAGFREDVAAALSILDVFVLASVLESCPNVVLEAMAMEVHVVATDVGAVSEMVLNDQTGLVVPPRDAGAIAAAVLTYLTGPKERGRNIVTAARKRVENTFSADIMAQQQYQIYEKVLGRAFSRPGPRKA